MKKTLRPETSAAPKKKRRSSDPAKSGRAPVRRYFSAADSVKVVQARVGANAHPRVRVIVDSLVKHLHAFVKETQLTQEEWIQGIEFLTRTGQLCNEWRQEFILLSDVLGISMLVETLNNQKKPGETESTVLGPFHVDKAPRYRNGANICLDGKGEPLWVQGRVTDAKGKPIAGATLDVWQANEDGFYDVQQKGIQPEMNLRGIFRAGKDGGYRFRTAYPRHYPIPFDGSVGGMLEALDREHFRPAHLHFIVSAPGYEPLTTHIFTPDCPYLDDDAVFGVKKSLIGDFRLVDDAKTAARLGMPNPYRCVEWDFVLSKTRKK